MDMDLSYISAFELRDAILKKKISAVEVMKETLIKQEKLEPFINSFVTKTPEIAMKSAEMADQSLAQGKILGPLHGLPISIKDNISVKDVKFTNGSVTSKTDIGKVDAPAVERIKKAGAAIIGKTTTTEFAIRSDIGYSPLTGTTRNPWDNKKTTGGSSAGSAASVASGVTPFSLGTDGGGSIRIPTSLCGIFGIKPQFGRVPIYPIGATPTLAHHAPMARTVRDAALLLQVISGFDDRDMYSVSEIPPNFISACDQSVKGMRIAWSPTFGYGNPNNEIIQIARKGVKDLESLGCHVDLIENVFDYDPIDIWEAEFLSGAGANFNTLINESKNLMDQDVLNILDKKETLTLNEYFLKVFSRYKIYDKIQNLFTKYDILVSPTLPVAPFDIKENFPKEISNRNIVSWTTYPYPFNLTGNPAASLPCGFTQEGLPIGLQIVAGKNKETDILKIASSFENKKPWTYKQPI